MLCKKAILWAALGWLLLAPPIRPANGVYVDAQGRPARVSIAAPLFQWRTIARFASGTQCESRLRKMRIESLSLNPSLAEVAANSFAKCVPEEDPRLRSPDGAVRSH